MRDRTPRDLREVSPLREELPDQPVGVLGGSRTMFLADPAERWLHSVASVSTEEPPEAVRVPIGPEGESRSPSGFSLNPSTPTMEEYSPIRQQQATEITRESNFVQARPLSS